MPKLRKPSATTPRMVVVLAVGEASLLIGIALLSVSAALIVLGVQLVALALLHDDGRKENS